MALVPMKIGDVERDVGAPVVVDVGDRLDHRDRARGRCRDCATVASARLPSASAISRTPARAPKVVSGWASPMMRVSGMSSSSMARGAVAITVPARSVT